MNQAISLSRILAPVEFSGRCRGAARYAESLARQFHAELTLLHVVAPPYVAYGEVSTYPSTADFLDQRWEQGRLDLDAFLADAPPGLAVQRVLLDGDPARRIVDHAHAGKFDLIVMPTHAYGPFRRFLLGSVTAKVLHDANCPVWTGPHLEQAPEPQSFALRRIACALDLGPQSCAALRWAAGMACRFSARLSILHALPPSTVSVGGISFDPEWRLQLEQDARRRIEEMLPQTGAQGDIRILVGGLEPAAAISQAVRDLQADLLVIGRSQRSGVLGRLRAVAYAIIREAPCPVASI